MHQGELAASKAELGAYMDSQHFRVDAEGMDKALMYNLMKSLSSVGDLERCTPLTLEGFLAGPDPDHVVLKETRLPLTW